MVKMRYQTMLLRLGSKSFNVKNAFRSGWPIMGKMNEIIANVDQD